MKLILLSLFLLAQTALADGQMCINRCLKKCWDQMETLSIAPARVETIFKHFIELPGYTLLGTGEATAQGIGFDEPDSGQTRAILQFDTSGIPVGATIEAIQFVKSFSSIWGDHSANQFAARILADYESPVVHADLARFQPPGGSVFALSAASSQTIEIGALASNINRAGWTTVLVSDLAGEADQLAMVGATFNLATTRLIIYYSVVAPRKRWLIKAAQ